MKNRRLSLLFCLWMVAAALQLSAQQKKPNILVIFGDDIGMWNVGAYTHGMMGRTPNIDSIAKTGILFTDHYGQPSCPAGRAAFITGQLPVRTGMTTIGIPGSPRGLQKEDPTLATLAFMDKNGKGDKPFFVWFNTTAIHIWSHPNPKYVQMAVDEGRAETDVVRAKMLEHDEQVGALLKKLDELGVATTLL